MQKRSGPRKAGRSMVDAVDQPARVCRTDVGKGLCGVGVLLGAGNCGAVGGASRKSLRSECVTFKYSTSTLAVSTRTEAT